MMKIINYSEYCSLLNEQIKKSEIVKMNCKIPTENEDNLYLMSKDGISYVNIVTGFMGGLCRIRKGSEKLAELHQNFRIKMGGSWLDCYDGKLVKLYEKQGFWVSERYPFDESLAPKGWEKTLSHKPDFLILTLVEVI